MTYKGKFLTVKGLPLHCLPQEFYHQVLGIGDRTRGVLRTLLQKVPIGVECAGHPG